MATSSSNPIDSMQFINKCCPDEIISKVLKYPADHRYLARCGQVCKRWNVIASQESIWREVCIRFWMKKTYVPKHCRLLFAKGQCRNALKSSLLDCKRTAITKEEFSSINFYFRFKKVAGSYWTSMDPFWQGRKPLQIRFSPDGPVVGFEEVKWNFVDQEGQACHDSGSFIRVTLKDVSVPTYMVFRHSNWGFIIQASDAATEAIKYKSLR